jgi:hypothetical protein
LYIPVFDLARNYAPHLTPEDRDILSSNIKVLTVWSRDDDKTVEDGDKTEESSAGESDCTMDSEPVVWSVSAKKSSGPGVTLKQMPPVDSPTRASKPGSKYKRSSATSAPALDSDKTGEIAAEEHEVIILIYIMQ